MRYIKLQICYHNESFFLRVKPKLSLDQLQLQLQVFPRIPSNLVPRAFPLKVGKALGTRLNTLLSLLAIKATSKRDFSISHDVAICRRMAITSQTLLRFEPYTARSETYEIGSSFFLIFFSIVSKICFRSFFP